MIKRKTHKSMSTELCSSLINFCRSGDQENVEHFITHYKFSDYPELFEGYILVYEALKHDNTEIVKLLLQNGANVNVSKNDLSESNTLVHLAVVRKNLEILKILLDENVDINASNKYKKTPLHVAIDHQNEVMVKLLLDNGANVKSKDQRGNTPLHSAVKFGNIDIIYYLLKHKADINSSCETNTSLYFAVKCNRVDIAKLLIQNGAMDTVTVSSYYSLLVLAVSQGNHKILSLLLESRNENLLDITNPESKASNDFNCLLHSAANAGHQEIIAVLLKYNFNINSRDQFGRTPIYHAYVQNKLEICKYLLANGFNVDSKIDDNVNILHMSVVNNNEEFVRFLLDKADVNAKTIDSSTSLHIACRKGYEKIVSLLLRNKIDVHVVNNMGSTCLHEAAKQDNEKIIKRLLRYGSLVNVTTKCQSTPLHFAVQSNHIHVVQRLLKNGADVNIKDSNKKSAICYAVESNNIKLVRLLLDINPDTCDKNNKLAFCLAVLGNSSEHRNMVDLFLIRRFTIKSGDFDDIPIPEPLYSKYGNEYNKTKYRTMFSDLLKRTPSLNGFFEYEILCCCIKKGIVIIVTDLLKSDVNVLLEESFTLLDIAMKNRQDRMVKELFKLGANSNTVDIHGNTLLHTSVLYDCADTTEFLLNKINIDSRNENKETALHLASRLSNCQIVKLILNSGADINCKNINDFTALHIAAENDDPSMVKLLLEYDADINIINNNGETPLSLAMCYQKIEVIPVLLNQDTLHYGSVPFGKFDITIFEHVIKSNVLCLGNFETDYEDLNKFSQKCNEEINIMLDCQLGMNVSLYDLLKKRISQVELYLRNKEILQFLDNNDLEESYPIYFGMLNARILKAKRRKLLIKLGSDALEGMCKIELPYLIVEKIFSYVNNLDLRNLVFASTNCDKKISSH